MDATGATILTGCIAAIIAISALVIAIWTFFTTRQHLILERVHKITDRLEEGNKICIEYPQIQTSLYKKWLEIKSSPSERKKKHFDSSIEHNDEYIRTKAYIYFNLTVFDELVSIAWGNKKIEKLIEFVDWKRFIIIRMQNPLFLELFDNESRIYGEKFRNFIEENRDTISAEGDPEIF